MGRDQPDLSESQPLVSASQRKAQLYGTTSELNRLAGQSQTAIAHGFFSILVRATGAQAGQLLLTDQAGNPKYVLILTKGKLAENPHPTSDALPSKSLAGKAYQQRRGILADAPAVDSSENNERDIPEVASDGSTLAVPITCGTQALGVLELIAQPTSTFDQTDLALITHLADQIALRLENARLNQSVDQTQQIVDALGQSAHTVSISVDLHQTLSTILGRLAETLFYRRHLILLYENDRLYPIGGARLQEIKQQLPRFFTPGDQPILFQVLAEGHTNLSSQNRYGLDLNALGFSDPVRKWAIVPLSARKGQVGLLILADSQPHPQDAQHVSTLNAFASHIAIAVDNHRLGKETERRLRELAFLNETGQAITSTLNLERILNLLLERVRELLQIDATSIVLRDEQSGEIVFDAASGAGAVEILGAQLNPGQGIAGWVAETGKPLLVRDVYSDPRFFDGIDRKTGVKTQAILCVPIVLKGRVVGVIEALNPDQTAFDDQTIELLTSLSGLAASAIENARLFAKVRNAEARYEGLFEDSANAILITDLNGLIVEVNRNACNLLGETQEDLAGANLGRLPSAEGNYDFVNPIKQIQAGHEAVFETIISSAGQRKTVEFRGKTVQVEGTVLIQWIGRDISAAVELEQMREDLVRMIVHDLRNPLANIMNSLAVLDDVIKERDETVSTDDLLTIAKRSGQRMQQLISSILDISRLETGQAILDTRPTDLGVLLEQAGEFVKPQTEIREIEFKVEIEADLPRIEIDEDMISRVVINLLDNASKFTQVRGKITLSATRKADRIEVAVDDNGFGIPADQLQSIFEKFTRVRQKDSPEGTGLGLAFCKLAVESHGGSIWAESIIGKGTTFRFTLPLEKDTPN